jgi:hypothetical protein
MPQPILQQDQREHLLTLIKRRLHELDDRTLLELERLTRSPHQLTGSTPTTKKVLSPLASLQAPSVIIHRPSKSMIGRRQLLEGLGVLAALGAVGGGVYVAGSRELRRSEEQYARLDATVQAAASYLGPNVRALAQQAQATADAALTIHNIAMDCADRYPMMRGALENWWVQIDVIRQDYQAMRLVEGFVKAVTDFLSVLATVPSVAIGFLDSPTIEVGNLDAISNALQAVGNLLTHLDSALSAADMAHSYLQPWFSGMGTDVKQLLLHPLQDEFCPSVCDLGEQCKKLQLDWQERFMQPVNAARQERI